jgi:hypothetical protein
MKRLFIHHFGLALIIALSATAQAGDSDTIDGFPFDENRQNIPLWELAPGPSTHEKKPSLLSKNSKIEWCGEERLASPCKVTGEGKQGYVHVRMTYGKQKVEGWMSRQYFDLFAKVQRGSPTTDPDQEPSNTEDTDSTLHPEYPIPQPPTVKRSYACPSCGVPAPVSIRKLDDVAKDTTRNIVREDYFSVPCEKSSFKYGAFSSVDLQEVSSEGVSTYKELSSDGSVVSQLKPVQVQTFQGKNGEARVVRYPATLCKARVVGGCGTPEDLLHSPQKILAAKIYEKADALSDKYADCLYVKSRNCETLSSAREMAEEKAKPLCRAATEAYYLCDPETNLPLEERRADIHKKIDEGFAKYSQSHFGKTEGTNLDPNLAKCLVEREDNSYQPYRMNLTACTTNNSSAIGLFQVTNILIEELLRTDHCSGLALLGFECKTKAQYYSTVYQNKAGVWIYEGLKKDILKKDAEAIQDKMSTKVDIQIQLGLMAMGFTLHNNYNNIGQALRAWKTGADAGQYSAAVKKCYKCVTDGDSGCFSQVHGDQKKR